MFKQLCMIISTLIASNIHGTQNSNLKQFNEYVKFAIPQIVQEHPVKTTVGGATALYGLKLIYEGSKTRNIKSDGRAYDSIGVASYVLGTALTIAGTTMLYKAVSSENTSNPEDAKS